MNFRWLKSSLCTRCSGVSVKHQLYEDGVMKMASDHAEMFHWIESILRNFKSMWFPKRKKTCDFNEIHELIEFECAFMKDFVSQDLKMLSFVFEVATLILNSSGKYWHEKFAWLRVYRTHFYQESGSKSTEIHTSHTSHTISFEKWEHFPMNRAHTKFRLKSEWAQLINRIHIYCHTCNHL